MTQKRQIRYPSSRGCTKLSSKDNRHILDLRVIDKVSDLMLIKIEMLCVNSFCGETARSRRLEHVAGARIRIRRGQMEVLSFLALVLHHHHHDHLSLNESRERIECVVETCHLMLHMQSPVKTLVTNAVRCPSRASVVHV